MPAGCAASDRSNARRAGDLSFSPGIDPFILHYPLCCLTTGNANTILCCCNNKTILDCLQMPSLLEIKHSLLMSVVKSTYTLFARLPKIVDWYLNCT